jgi:hypothetical protein
VKICMLLVMSLCGSGPTGKLDNMSVDSVESWRGDLEFVSEKLPESHANLFHTLSRKEFDNALASLSGRLPALNHTQAIVELATIVASVSDGHTRLTLPISQDGGFFQGHTSTPLPNNSDMFFHHYPIRLYLYEDGLFVRRISNEYANYASAKVLRIGSLSSQQAIDAVSSTIHKDNSQQLKQLLPSRLVIPEVLHALGVVNDVNHATFLLQTQDGSSHELVLAPVAESDQLVWTNAVDSLAVKPPYLTRPDAHFWFEYREAEKLVYLQFNEVYDTELETLAAFSKRLEQYINDNDVEKLVVDLRFNTGGDNTLNSSLLHALIRSPKLRDPGSLFAITGRATFSAAMMFALDLEKHTNVIFVGEATGGKPNHYGDSRKLQLPNSGLTIRASSLYWQYGGPKDFRNELAPHIPIAMSSMDYLQGHDPAMEEILALVSEPIETGKPEGVWNGNALGYRIAVKVNRNEAGLEASLDFPDEEVVDLPLTNVVYEDATLQFDFENGGNIIRFKGKITHDTIIGGVTLQGQERPWVVLRVS